MIKRLVAIGFIFTCTSIAWFILAGVTASRTDSADGRLRHQVQRLWGSPQVQHPPVITAHERYVKREVTEEDGRRVVRKVDAVAQHRAPLASGDIRVTLGLDYRQKGLLWYSTYNVSFEGAYAFANDAATAREFEVALPLPAKHAVFDDLRFEIDGKPWTRAPVAGEDRMSGWITLSPGEQATLRVGYRSQGMDRWSYQFGAGVTEVRNFRLAMTTDFADIDFPDGGMSPTRKTRTDAGWTLAWEFRRLVSGSGITLLMPEKLQPGPLASQIAQNAPISLFFFIVVLLTLGVVRGVALHPMHFFFLAASFFSFHLMLAYLADHMSIHAAFGIAAVVSLLLTTTYLRVAFGNRFAFAAAGGAQLVYLVLFSYAFFFKGLTGLAITIGAVVTLFVLMQVTARVDWRDALGTRAVLPAPEAATDARA